MWLWVLIACVIVLSLGNNKKDFCDTPMVMWVGIGAVIAYFYIYNNKYSQNENFDSSNDKKMKKFKVYNFNTSWCGWSKRFQPEWDAFTVACKTSKNIETVDVKCDDDNNKDVCNKYNVPGYPYVIVEVDGDPRPYDGERTSDAIMGYIKTVL